MGRMRGGREREKKRAREEKKRGKKVKRGAAYFAAGISAPPRVRHFSCRGEGVGGMISPAFPASYVALPSFSLPRNDFSVIRRETIARRLRDESNETVSINTDAARVAKRRHFSAMRKGASR